MWNNHERHGSDFSFKQGGQWRRNTALCGVAIVSLHGCLRSLKISTNFPHKSFFFFSINIVLICHCPALPRKFIYKRIHCEKNGNIGNCRYVRYVHTERCIQSQWENRIDASVRRQRWKVATFYAGKTRRQVKTIASGHRRFHADIWRLSWNDLIFYANSLEHVPRQPISMKNVTDVKHQRFFFFFYQHHIYLHVSFNLQLIKTAI